MKIKKYINIALILSLPLLTIGCTNDKEENNYKLDENIKNEEFVLNEYVESTENQSAVIFLYDTESDSLISKEVEMESIDVNSLIEIMKKEGLVNTDTQVLNFDIIHENNGIVGKLNLSEDYYNYNLGSTVSSGMLNALAQTLLENLEIDRLQIFINGEFYEDGHVLLDESFYFTNTSVGNLDINDLPAN